MPGLPSQTTHHVHADMPAKAPLRTEQFRAAQTEVDDLRLLAAEATGTHSKVGHDTRSSTGRAGAARFLRWCVLIPLANIGTVLGLVPSAPTKLISNSNIRIHTFQKQRCLGRLGFMQVRHQLSR